MGGQIVLDCFCIYVLFCNPAKSGWVNAHPTHSLPVPLEEELWHNVCNFPLKGAHFAGVSLLINRRTNAWLSLRKRSHFSCSHKKIRVLNISSGRKNAPIFGIRDKIEESNIEKMGP